LWGRRGTPIRPTSRRPVQPIELSSVRFDTWRRPAC
jgi:hypothetical protein